MSRTFKTFQFGALALVAGLALAPAAFADTRAPAAIRVAYGDLDMSANRAGEILLKRIDKAAGKVCGERWRYSQVNPYGRSECRHETVASVVQQLGFATLNLAWNKAQPPVVQTASR